MTRNINKLVDHFISTDQLGHYDSDKHSITLYDISNTSSEFRKIKNAIDGITKKYKIIILSPDKSFTNINILDIDL